jgi:hypothetical protein
VFAGTQLEIAARTVPVIVVVVPAVHVARCAQRPVHEGPTPQTPGCPPAPQAWPAGQVAPQSSAFPQPSPAGPQVKP